jgi:hypothetical protein
MTQPLHTAICARPHTAMLPARGSVRPRMVARLLEFAMARPPEVLALTVAPVGDGCTRMRRFYSDEAKAGASQLTDNRGGRVSTDDKYACAEVIQSWGLFRDQNRWDELLETFTPDGTIAVSWFRGSFLGFVEQCRLRSVRSGRSKHLLTPSVVRVAGDRALAETSVVILVRQEIKGTAVDLTSYARFLDRLERRREWKIAERAAVYEHDRLDPVEPSVNFAEMIQRANCTEYPAPYRYMAFRIISSGGALATPVHCDGTPETEELRARYEAWFEENDAH